MSRNAEFVKNTFILFIGKFATQFTSFLLLPLFTHFLVTDDYGLVDLLQTYISLFVPVLTLRMDSAVFRFLIDNRKSDKQKTIIITNVIYITLIGTISTASIFLFLTFFIKFKYVYLTIINVTIMMLSNVLLQMLRGLGKNKQYSLASIITGVFCLVLNTSLIVFFNCGASSILISSSLSNVIVILYAIYSSNLFKYIDIKKIDKGTIKKLICYSLPMIPNSLSWWIVNVSDRTIISIFLGAGFNGIYTVSSKMSNLLNSAFSIFNMSWQETTSLHINDNDKDFFFSEMINKMFIAFSCIALCINAILPICYNFIIGYNYIASYNYIPILLYANSWNILISLIGGIYIAMKKTKEIASTTIISAIINLVVNLLLIKKIGLYAACISTLLAYLIMSIYRYKDCQKYIKIKLDFLKIMIFTIAFVFSSVLYYMNNIYFNLLNIIISVGFSIVFNKFIIKKIISRLFKKFHLSK